MSKPFKVNDQIFTHEQLIQITWRDGTVTQGMILLEEDYLDRDECLIIHNHSLGGPYMGPHQAQYKNRWGTSMFYLETSQSSQIKTIMPYCNKPRD